MLETVADGNCAFNAFSLGLKHLIIDKKLDANNLPENFVNDAIGVGKQWDDANKFITWISEEKELVKVQTTLAPVLRTISIQYLRTTQESTAILDAAFKVAIDDFAAHKDTVANPDNVFRLIPEIKAQFEKLTATPPTITIKELNDWWDQNGRDHYFDYMQQPATDANNVSRWGSHVELDALAMIFDVSVRFSKDKKDPQVLGCPFGFFDPRVYDANKPATLNDFQLKILCDRNILAEKNNGYMFEKNFETLAQAVPYAAELIAAIEKHTDTNPNTALTIDQWLTDANIPKGEHEHVKNSLKAHGAITNEFALQDGENGPPNLEEIKDRINKIDNDVKEYLKKKHKPQQPNFSIDLSGDHWSFSPESISTVKPNLVTESQPSKTDNVARSKAEQQFKAHCDNLGYKVNAAGSIMGKENDFGKRQELITYKKTKDDAFELETKAGLNDNIADIALLMALKLRSHFKTAVVTTTPELAHIYARAFLAAGFEAKNITIKTEERKPSSAKEEQPNPMADMMRSMGRSS